MLSYIKRLFHRWLRPEVATVKSAATVSTTDKMNANGNCAVYHDLFDKCRDQWIKGDWRNLAQLREDQIFQHPERAKLALLSASGSLQIGLNDNAMRFLALAKKWGCSDHLISRIILSGVCNNLGRVATVLGEINLARDQYRQAVELGLNKVAPNEIDERIKSQSALLTEDTEQT